MKNFTNNIFDTVKNLFYLLIVLGFSTMAINAQEICNNGIDDDGDNLVDCADPDCSGDSNCDDTFTCSSDLFQVTSGTLKVLDPSTGVYTTLGPSATGYNGTGYNVQDGYIYGISSGPSLIQINNTGTGTVLGSINNFTGLTYSGDFDLDGNWLSFTKTSGNWFKGTLDVDVYPLTMTSSNVTDLSTNVAALVCADISYNAVTNKYYGCSNGTVVEFDPINNTVRGLASFSNVTGNGGFGASWSDIEGNTYFFQNSSGNIYRTQFDENGEVADFSFIAVSEPNGNNDGMSCPLSNPPVFPEICNNGIDDDGDGLVDCDDPDCTLNEDCGEICDNGIDDDGDGLIDGDDPQCSVGSGSQGGLESNRRLSKKISRRNYKKAILAPVKLNEITTSSRANGYIQNFIPQDLVEGSTLLDASPSDLIDITNASDIYSTDVMVNERRMASILAIQTENEVYEHTKYICDRLDGAIIHDLKTVNMYGVDFVVSEIIQASGNVEYAISFAAYEDENGFFNIESHWNLDKYSTAQTLLNFQIWANDLFLLHEIAEKILDNINEQGQIATVNNSPKPDTYVSTGKYENGQLHLRIVNTQRATEFNFEGSYTSTETGSILSFDEQVNTYGNGVENISIKVGSIYDIGFRISTNTSTTTDDLFFADGAWGLDYDANQTDINHFTISENEAINLSNSEFLVHRNVAFEAYTSESVAVYRSFTPKFRSKNFSDYNVLNLSIEGEGTLEVTMSKTSIENWENQYKTSVEITTDKTDYTIVMADLVSASTNTTIDMSDLNMMVLKFIPSNGNDYLNINIEDIIFDYDENATQTSNNSTIGMNIDALKESYCYPNPAKSETQLLFETNEVLSYELIIVDNAGKTVFISSGETQKGLNKIDVNLQNIEKGLYFYTLATNTINYWKGKIIVVE